MLPSIFTEDPSNGILICLLLYAGLLPAATYLTISLREGSRSARSLLERLHLVNRRLIRLNAFIVQRQVEDGVQVLLGANVFTPPFLTDDATRTAQEIADDEQARLDDFSVQDHREQLERITRDIQTILTQSDRESFRSGFNIGVLLASAVLILAGVITSVTGVGLALAALGVLLLLSDIIIKLTNSGLAKSADARAQELQAEVEEKRMRFEEALRKLQAGA